MIIFFSIANIFANDQSNVNDQYNQSWFDKGSKYIQDGFNNITNNVQDGFNNITNNVQDGFNNIKNVVNKGSQYLQNTANQISRSTRLSNMDDILYKLLEQVIGKKTIQEIWNSICADNQQFEEMIKAGFIYTILNTPEINKICASKTMKAALMIFIKETFLNITESQLQQVMPLLEKIISQYHELRLILKQNHQERK